MPSRSLGSSGLEVSRLGFGAATLGDIYGDVDPEEATRAVRRTIDAGITLFDCSPYYGITLAEERLGRALDGVRDATILMTKCGRYDVADFDFSRTRVLTSVDESLTRLRTDYLDVYLAHDVEFGDVKQIIEETIPALHEVKQSGKARLVGITGLPVTHLRSIAEAASVDVILSYCRANLLDSGALRTLSPFCRERGIGLVNASPLHMGILTENTAPAWHPAPPQVKALGRELDAICRAHDTTIAQTALSYALHLEGVDATLCGMKTVAEVEANLAALEQEPTTDLLLEIRRAVGDLADFTWLQGRPENSRDAGEARYVDGSS